ncbi:MAG TPA: hypothetical protein VIE39_02920 [Thermoanaerobaculia bacterium]
MSGSPEGPPVWSRGEAIARLRRALLARTDEEHSLCEVAAEKGIFCRGFRRFDDAEFRRRFRGTIGESPRLNRVQMEQVANLLQLSLQLRWRVSLACDAQKLSRGGHCRGWDEFSNAQLGRFCADILDQSVVVR